MLDPKALEDGVAALSWTPTTITSNKTTLVTTITTTIITMIVVVVVAIIESGLEQELG